MHLIITDAWVARRRALHLNGWQLAWAGLVMSFALVLVSLGLYHWVFLEGARQGWPVVGPLARMVIRSELASQEFYMRENLDAMARRLGQMQARMAQLESLGERVAGLAGIEPLSKDGAAANGAGGAPTSPRKLSMEEFNAVLASTENVAATHTDWFTVIESRLLDEKISRHMVPTAEPVYGGRVGSPFGMRIDPITGQLDMHRGLDFPAEVGTPIYAAAGGVVVTALRDAAYGNLLEIDHGNNLSTRYGHASRLLVKRGDLIRRGQKIAEVGSTGRSTGPHLHFEVLVSGVQQNPKKFLDSGSALAAREKPRKPVSSEQGARAGS